MSKQAVRFKFIAVKLLTRPHYSSVPIQSRSGLGCRAGNDQTVSRWRCLTRPDGILALAAASSWGQSDHKSAMVATCVCGSASAEEGTPEKLSAEPVGRTHGVWGMRGCGVWGVGYCYTSATTVWRDGEPEAGTEYRVVDHALDIIFSYRRNHHRHEEWVCELEMRKMKKEPIWRSMRFHAPSLTVFKPLGGRGGLWGRVSDGQIWCIGPKPFSDPDIR